MAYPQTMLREGVLKAPSLEPAVAGRGGERRDERDACNDASQGRRHSAPTLA